MHKAIVKTKENKTQEIYFNYELHSPEYNITIFKIGAKESYTVPDERIITKIYDDSLFRYEPF